MKPRLQQTFAALTLCLAGIAGMQCAHAAAFTWDGAPDGGGSSANANWSTGDNWIGDLAPSGTGHTLTFAGTTNLNAVNDTLSSLATSGTAITFASGAGSFNLSGNTLTLGSGGGGGQTIVQQNSANNQTISANINLSGGSGDRSIVFGSGAGSLTLSGNINFSNDWLFPTTGAGTIILTGTNTGDGKAYNAGGVTAGSNTMNAMMRNNVDNTQLILGGDSVLGNVGSGSISAGTAAFRGVLANKNLFIGTSGGNRNLSGSTLAINTGWIDFNGTSNLTIGNLINQGGNRDFKVTSTGQLTVQNSISLSNDQTGRNLYLNLSGTGGMVVNGKIHDTFHSGGITTGQGTLRKAGSGTLTLNGDSAYGALTTIENGTLKLGHANALGATGTGSGTAISGNGILDLNGVTTGESITVNSSSSRVINSSASAAGISADVTLNSDLTVDATGDLTATRLVGTATRIVTKLGAGTLTTNGSNHNNLTSWNIQAGKVVFANTSGYGADRGVTLNGGTLQISGGNSNLINDNEDFTINTGTFDLNGKNEAVASIGGAGGNVTNTAATAATLYVGGGAGGTSSATYGGTIQDGTGGLSLTKQGSGTQTLNGTSTYTGATTISGGTLALGATGSIDNTSGVSLGTGGTFDVSAKTGGYTVATLVGSGTVVGSLTVSTQLAIGNSPGTTAFDSLTLGSSSIYHYELTGGDSTADLGNIAGSLTLDTGSVLDLIQLGTYTLGDKFTLFGYQTGSLTGTFDGLADGATFTDAGGDWRIHYFDTTAGLNGGTGTRFVTITAVPEPAAALLGGIGMLVLTRRRRS